MNMKSLRRRRAVAAILVCLSVICTVEADDMETAIRASCPGYMAWAQQHANAEKSRTRSFGDGTDAALKAELIKMAAEDQQARPLDLMQTLGHPDPIAFNHMLVVDRRHLRSLHEIIAVGGIPTPQRVGREGIDAFWLLVQHADETALQEQVLKEFAAGNSGVAQDEIAMLTDRVRGREGRPALYGGGLHLSGKEWVPDPIEDEAHVNERRAAMDLAPLSDYLCVMRVLYKVHPAQ